MTTDCKLVPSWLVAKRDAGSAFHFVNDLAARLASQVQLTTDGNRVYLEAVEGAFGSEIDCAMLVKLYGADPQGEHLQPSEVHRDGSAADHWQPRPGPRLHQLRRAPEPHDADEHTAVHPADNAFSKKVENQRAAVDLYAMHYNFGRIYQTLRVTPATIPVRPRAPAFPTGQQGLHAP
jgi:hypothetical protein